MCINLLPVYLTFRLPSYGKIALCQICQKRWHIPRWGQWKPNTKPPLGYQLAPWPLTMDDLELFRVIKITCQYCKNGDRYDNGVNRSRIGNHSWAIDWHHDVWPWMTLDCRRFRSRNLHIKYLECPEKYNVGQTEAVVEITCTVLHNYWTRQCIVYKLVWCTVNLCKTRQNLGFCHWWIYLFNLVLT